MAHALILGIRTMRVHCLVAGTHGDPVVLLHGGGIDSAALTYRYTLPALASHARVYAPDWPGYGRSSAPDRPADLAFYTDVLDALLDRLNLTRPSLVGISLGGGAALGYALRRPERVARLVLVDSYGLGRAVPWGWLGALLVHLPGVNEVSWALLRRSRRLLRLALRNVVANPTVLTEELVDEAWHLLQRRDAGRAFTTMQQREVGLAGLRTDFSGQLDQLRMPVLLAHGASDHAVPLAWAQRAERRIPGAQLHVFRQSGHWPPREEPTGFNQVVGRFLRATAPSDSPSDAC